MIVLIAAMALFAIAIPLKADASCFRDHLNEAIHLNLERKPIYARISNGRTSKISAKLISGERLAKFASYIFFDFDVRARDYQSKGVNIVCDEFVSMQLTPPFRAISPAPTLRKFQTFDAAEIEQDLGRALGNGFSQVRLAAHKWIEHINHAEPRFNCMTRHVLESIARIATLAPGHVAKSEALGLPSTEPLSRDMIASHFLTFTAAGQIDLLAAPIQADGIAIICQDVPPITY